MSRKEIFFVTFSLDGKRDVCINNLLNLMFHGGLRRRLL